MPRPPATQRRPSVSRARRAAALVLVLAPVLALAPSAAQASPRALIHDCLTNGRIAGHYSQQDYSQALANLPTDVAEYSDCAGVIRRAQLSSAAGGGGGGGGAFSTRSGSLTAAGGAGTAGADAAATANPRQDPLASAAPAERAAIAAARRAGASPQDVGGALLRPGAVATQTSSVFNSLPTPLLVALAALALIALAVGGRYARDLVRARRCG